MSNIKKYKITKNGIETGKEIISYLDELKAQGK